MMAQILITRIVIEASFRLLLAMFALRRLVDDYELVDVSVSLFTVQLCCA